MTLNYDTTNGMPFVYFGLQSVKKDPVTGVVTITYTDRWALKSADGVTRFLDAPAELRQFSIAPDDLPRQVPYVDLATGAHLPEKSSYGQIMVGIVAAIRADQEGRDAAEEAASIASEQLAQQPSDPAVE